MASGQVLQTSQAVSRAMTTEQLLRAEPVAAGWPSKAQKIPAALIGEVRDGSKRMRIAAASD